MAAKKEMLGKGIATALIALLAIVDFAGVKALGRITLPAHALRIDVTQEPDISSQEGLNL